MAITSLPAPAGPGTRIEWTTPPYLMVRLAGLPFDLVDSLRFEESVAWAEEMLRIESELRSRKDVLADALEAEVAEHAGDPAARQRLINFRRSVFNLRRPAASTLADLAPIITAATAADMETWFGLWRRHDDTGRLGAAIVERELANRRSALRDLARKTDLRDGILLASPVLDRQMSTYLDGPPTGLTKRMRRIERSLVEYLFRSACKTSPFSTFSGVCLAGFGPDGSGPVSVELDDPAKRSYVRLNMAELSRLSSIMADDASLREDLLVTLTGGWQSGQGRIRYLRRRSSPRDADDGPVAIDPVHESLFSLPAGRLLDHLLDLLGDGRIMRFGDAAEILSGPGDGHGEPEVPGGPDVPAGPERADVRTYLGHLLRLGLLVTPDLQVDIHHPEPLRGYTAGLRRIGRPWAVRLATRLDRVDELISRYADQDLAGRRACVEAVRAELQTAHHELRRADVPVPATVIYEDTTYRPSQATVNPEAWDRDVSSTLTELARLLPVFDMNLPRRLVTKGFFRARFGLGGRHPDFLAFAHEFNRDFFEHYTTHMMRRGEGDQDGRPPRHENWLRIPAIDQIDAARAEVASAMSRAYRALPPGATELVLGRDFIDQIGPLIPTDLGALEPRSFFAQLSHDDPQGTLVVLNRVYNGLTLLYSRFAHCFPGGEGGRLVAALRTALSDAQPPGAVFAELKGGYDATNLNLHPAVTPYELVCPGEISTRPEDERIPIDDLEIYDDVEADTLRLRSKRLGVEVIPVYLGFLLPLALPEVQQVLLNFSYLSLAQVQLWSGAEVQVPGETIAEYPRVRYKNVVIHRRMWKVHPDYLPRPDAGQPADQRLLAWVRWRKDNGLPRRVFATPDAEPGPGEGQTAEGSGSYKPLFVDFENYFSISLLEASARTARKRLVFMEMLPDREHLWARCGAAEYVSELTFELNGVRR